MNSFHTIHFGSRGVNSISGRKELHSGARRVNPPSGLTDTSTSLPSVLTWRLGSARTSDVSTLSSRNTSSIAPSASDHSVGNFLRRGIMPDRRPGWNTELSLNVGSPVTGRDPSAVSTGSSLNVSTPDGAAPGSPESNTPTWPSRSTANQVVSMLCAAGKSTWHGNPFVIDSSTERYAEIRERCHERRVGQRRQGSTFVSV